MPDKYHIKTHPVPPKYPRIGKFGIVDWREDCARCHNCVKKACVYDRYRQETEYIRGLKDVDTFFFECKGCFSCVQNCTKGLLALTNNPAFERLGNSYWTPEIIQTTWFQAETGKIPVSGAGYRGKFSGSGFDSMWTDMSEIVRPTRDGIHGREYISTAVDIGRKSPQLSFDGQMPDNCNTKLVDIPLPLIIDKLPSAYNPPGMVPILLEAAIHTGILVIIGWLDWENAKIEKEKCLPWVVFHIGENIPLPPREVLQGIRMIEIDYCSFIEQRINEIKSINPEIVIAVRVILDSEGAQRSIELAKEKHIEVIHLVADINGNQFCRENPGFIKDIVRQIHTSLVKIGVRDEVTIIAGGGIALAEHMAKQILCGADLVSIELPLLVAVECQLCNRCITDSCPIKIRDLDADYATGRMTNLLAAWHDQLVEMMGAMGIREVRRLRGETGRALFFEDLEEETFGRLFGARKKV